MYSAHTLRTLTHKSKRATTKRTKRKSIHPNFSPFNSSITLFAATWNNANFACSAGTSFSIIVIFVGIAESFGAIKFLRLTIFDIGCILFGWVNRRPNVYQWQENSSHQFPFIKTFFFQNDHFTSSTFVFVFDGGQRDATFVLRIVVSFSIGFQVTATHPSAYSSPFADSLLFGFATHRSPQTLFFFL